MADQSSSTEPAARRARRPRWQRYALEAGLFLLVFGAVQAWHARDVPRGPAPAFAATLAGGGQTSLADWRAAHPGRAVAVYFWADWCPICRAQQGSIDDLGRDWPVLTVAMQSGDGAAVSRVLRERGLNWAAAVDAD
ncbi:MAG TPA: redoxin domain-containing protein, partial [Rhodocyclaceae bacterium]|nr:redoxin domain-containing protein [Rhodocyclaceae bacterium]